MERRCRLCQEGWLCNRRLEKVSRTETIDGFDDDGKDRKLQRTCFISYHICDPYFLNVNGDKPAEMVLKVYASEYEEFEVLPVSSPEKDELTQLQTLALAGSCS